MIKHTKNLCLLTSIMLINTVTQACIFNYDQLRINNRVWIFRLNSVIISQNIPQMYVVKKWWIRTTYINSHYLKMSGTNLNIIISLHDIPYNIHTPSQPHELTSSSSFIRNVTVFIYQEECLEQSSNVARQRSHRWRCLQSGAQFHLVPEVPASAGWQWHSLGGWWS